MLPDGAARCTLNGLIVIIYANIAFDYLKEIYKYCILIKILLFESL